MGAPGGKDICVNKIIRKKCQHTKQGRDGIREAKRNADALEWEHTAGVWTANRQ